MPPSSICHAVRLSTEGACRWNMRLLSTVPAAQAAPPAIARVVLTMLPMSCHGSMMHSSPSAASASPSQCRAVGRSPSSSHASSTAQNGMV